MFKEIQTTGDNIDTLGEKRIQTELYLLTAAAAAKSLQSCPTLCDPRDGSPPGYSVHGIFQARVLEWVAIVFSNNCLIKH